MKNYHNPMARINERIGISPVRVVKEGENLGLLSLAEAVRLAKADGMDLVEVSSNTRPPVCRIMDYGKFKYEQTIKDKKQKKHSKASQFKEVRLRPVTQEHDLDTKIKAVLRFLESGHSVAIYVKFKSRETDHKELGFNLLNQIIERTAVAGRVRTKPALQGKILNCVLEPIK